MLNYIILHYYITLYSIILRLRAAGAVLADGRFDAGLLEAMKAAFTYTYNMLIMHLQYIHNIPIIS